MWTPERVSPLSTFETDEPEHNARWPHYEAEGLPSEAPARVTLAGAARMIADCTCGM